MTGRQFAAITGAFACGVLLMMAVFNIAEPAQPIRPEAPLAQLSEADINRLLNLDGEWKVFTVAGTGSMSPAIGATSRLLVSPAELVEVGDIVVYEREGDLIVHRIVQDLGDSWVCQGDAYCTADLPILKSAVLFRVDAIFY